MTHFNAFTKKMLSAMMAAALVVPAMATTSYAAAPTEEGSYAADATLSCYVQAMGGVEFSDGYGLLKGTTVTIDESGNATATLSLGTTSGLSVYGVSCTAFIGVDEAPGYYKSGAVTKEGVTFTQSEDTAANSKGQVNYINSITMPVDTSIEEYTMWMYLDSNVMGCQLGDGSGSGASNVPGVATKHTAKLTIDWDSLEKTVPVASTSTSDAVITYVYDSAPTYEIDIPKKVDLATASNGEGSYKITLTSATNFAEGDYITVTAPESGELKSGSYKTTYTHTLAAHKLTKANDSVSGAVKVATPPQSGTYTGTLTFTINLHSNSK